MRVIFVAGPYRSKSEWGVHQNVRRAELLSLNLWRLGFAVLCPHKNTEYFGGAVPDAVWLAGALEMVRRCDAVVCTPDWRESEGSQGEVTLAHALGIPVFETAEEATEWQKTFPI